MRQITLLASWLVICAGSFGLAQTSTSASQSVVRNEFADAVSAEPPMQHTAWSVLKSRLPKELVAAGKTLFDQGLPDPRACEYREIVVSAYDYRGVQATTISTHGWVIRSTGKASPRFALCWNGLIYPLVSADKKADLRADVLDAIHADRVAFVLASHFYIGSGAGPAPSVESFEDGFNRAWHAPRFHQSYEITSATYRVIRRIWAPLLLRFGEIDLAEKVWLKLCPGFLDDKVQKPPAPTDPAADGDFGPSDPEPPYDPYLDIAEEWTWPLFDRAYTAHLRGDDRMALSASQKLATLWEAVQVEGMNHDTEHLHPTWLKKPRPVYLPGIASIRELAADQRRRAAERKAGKSPPIVPLATDDPQATYSALKRALDRCLNEAERVALLLREMEEISALEIPSTPETHLLADPIFRLLVEEGEPAVKPLLDCLASDSRLTRALAFGEEEQRAPQAVCKAAYEVLLPELTKGMPSLGYTLDRVHWPSRVDTTRTKRAQAIRNYFENERHIPQYERCFRILKDDGAPIQDWVAAAQALCNPTQSAPADYPWQTNHVNWTADPRGPLLGEPLRGRTNPSLPQLLEKRTNEMPLGGQLQVGNVLAKWEPEAAWPVLCAQTRTANLEFQSLAGSLTPQAYPSIGNCTELYRLRAQCRDPRAGPDYFEWVRKMPPKLVKDQLTIFFSPLFAIRDEGAGTTDARWLFNDPQSPWKSLAGIPSSEGPAVTVDLLPLSEFQEQVLRLLGNKNVVGRDTIAAGNETVDSLVLGEWEQVDTRLLANMPYVPANGSNTFRVCDVVAHNLSAVRGLPQCEMYWNESDRDKAVTACRRLLKQFRGNMKESQSSYQIGPQSFFVSATKYADIIILPKLDHPAGADDVETGRAIFSLAGEGDSRVLKVEANAGNARWTTLRDAAYSRMESDPKTTAAKKIVDYDRTGRICQVEEVHVDGVWKCYYGFIGRHTIGKAPAEEIVFDNATSPDTTSLIDGVNIWVETVNERGEEFEFPGPGMKSPETVKVMVRNYSSHDQQLPRITFCNKPAPKENRFDVQLFYADRQRGDTFESQVSAMERGDPSLAWRELRKKDAVFHECLPDRPLRPAEDWCLLEFKWRDYFQAAGPGLYECKLKDITGGRPDNRDWDIIFFIKDQVRPSK